MSIDWFRFGELYYRFERCDDELAVFIQCYSPITPMMVDMVLSRDGKRMIELEFIQKKRFDNIGLFFERWDFRI